MPAVGQSLPRAERAFVEPRKVDDWILSPRGHGDDWTAVFGVRPSDGAYVWEAIAVAVRHAVVDTVRDRSPHGVVCGVLIVVTLNGRTAAVATAWHYADDTCPPRLVAAYPKV